MNKRKNNICQFFCKKNEVRIFKRIAFLGLITLPMVLSACGGLDEESEGTPCIIFRGLEDEKMKYFRNDLLMESIEITEGKKGRHGCRYAIDAIKDINNLHDTKNKEEGPTQESDNVKEPVPENKKKISPPRFRRTIDVILRDQRVDKELWISRVKAGDMVEVKVRSGVRKESRFSSIYDVSVEASWKNHFCEDPSKSNISKRCGYIEEKGKCVVSHRDYLGKNESPIPFDKDSKSIDLVLRIGDKEYNFEEIKYFKGFNDPYLYASLQINEDMLSDGINELYIKPIVESKGEVKVGFQDYSYCPRKAEKDFSIGKSDSSTTMLHEVTREFNVSLEILNWQLIEEKEEDQNKKGAGHREEAADHSEKMESGKKKATDPKGKVANQNEKAVHHE